MDKVKLQERVVVVLSGKKVYDNGAGIWRRLKDVIKSIIPA
jgi:hypothetical protein